MSSVAELMEDVHQRRALLSDMNSISAIVGLLSSPNLKTQAKAASALAALSQEEQAREVLYRLGTLSHVIRSLAASNLRQEPGAPNGGALDADTAAARTDGARRRRLRRGQALLRHAAHHHPALRRHAHARGRPFVTAHAARAITSLSHSEPNRDALRDAGALPRMAALLLHEDEQVQQCAVQAVANLGVDANDAKTFLASGWHLSLISLSRRTPRTCRRPPRCAGQPLLRRRLPPVDRRRRGAPADPAAAPRACAPGTAVRALAIMSHQLMSAEVAADDPAATEFVTAIFDAAALPQLLGVLAAPKASDPTSAAIAERRLVAALLPCRTSRAATGRCAPAWSRAAPSPRSSLAPRVPLAARRRPHRGRRRRLGHPRQPSARAGRRGGAAAGGRRRGAHPAAPRRKPRWSRRRCAPSATSRATRPRRRCSRRRCPAALAATKPAEHAAPGSSIASGRSPTFTSASPKPSPPPRRSPPPRSPPPPSPTRRCSGPPPGCSAPWPSATRRAPARRRRGPRSARCGGGARRRQSPYAAEARPRELPTCSA